MTNAWWVRLADGNHVCCEAETQEKARALVEDVRGPVATGDDAIRILPYPASPRLNFHSSDGYEPCPSFCYSPNACAGRTSCPRSYACSE